MQPQVRINPNAEVRLESIADGVHCAVIDDFLADPDAVVEYAIENASHFSAARSYYPGICLTIDDDAIRDIHRFIRFRMSRKFSFLKSGLKFSSHFAMATLQPESLSLRQRICHTDAPPDSVREPFAALIYLFRDEAMGGTSFFRYGEKHALLADIEAAAETDADKADAMLSSHFPTLVGPAAYMTESNEIAERLCTIPPRFNRMIFYSGMTPHSAAITRPERLSGDVSDGRLTMNIFADASTQ